MSNRKAAHTESTVDALITWTALPTDSLKLWAELTGQLMRVVKVLVIMITFFLCILSKVNNSAVMKYKTVNDLPLYETQETEYLEFEK